MQGAARCVRQTQHAKVLELSLGIFSCAIAAARVPGNAGIPLMGRWLVMALPTRWAQPGSRCCRLTNSTISAAIDATMSRMAHVPNGIATHAAWLHRG